MGSRGTGVWRYETRCGGTAGGFGRLEVGCWTDVHKVGRGFPSDAFKPWREVRGWRGSLRADLCGGVDRIAHRAKPGLSIPGHSDPGVVVFLSSEGLASEPWYSAKCSDPYNRRPDDVTGPTFTPCVLIPLAEPRQSAATARGFALRPTRRAHDRRVRPYATGTAHSFRVCKTNTTSRSADTKTPPSVMYSTVIH